MSFRRIFFAALSLVLSLPLTSRAQETIAEPIYQNGECWTFKVISGGYISSTTRDIIDGEHRICVTNKTLVSIQDGKRYRLSNFWSFAFPMKERDTLHYLTEFPLVVGQKWSHQYESVLRGTNRRIKRTSETNILGSETVTTPAGSFGVLKIERGIWDGGTMAEKVDFFWSAQTKSAVKYKYQTLVSHTATRDIELIRYQAKAGNQK